MKGVIGLSWGGILELSTWMSWDPKEKLGARSWFTPVVLNVGSDESKRLTREALSCSDILEVCVCGVLEGVEPLRWLLLLVESSSVLSGSVGPFSSLSFRCRPGAVAFAWVVCLGSSISVSVAKLLRSCFVRAEIVVGASGVRGGKGAVGRVTAAGGLLRSGSIRPLLFLFSRRLIGLGVIVDVVVQWSLCL